MKKTLREELMHIVLKNYMFFYYGMFMSASDHESAKEITESILKHFSSYLESKRPKGGTTWKEDNEETKGFLRGYQHGIDHYHTALKEGIK